MGCGKYGWQSATTCTLGLSEWWISGGERWVLAQYTHAGLHTTQQLLNMVALIFLFAPALHQKDVKANHIGQVFQADALIETVNA